MMFRKQDARRVLRPAQQERFERIMQNLHRVSPKRVILALVYTSISYRTGVNQGRDFRAYVMPFAALIRVALLRGALRRWKLRARLLAWVLECCTPKERPGWNDYYMLLWQGTRDPAIAANLFERALRDGAVGETARWMLRWQCQRMPDLSEQLSQAARARGLQWPNVESLPSSLF